MLGFIFCSSYLNFKIWAPAPQREPGPTIVWESRENKEAGAVWKSPPAPCTVYSEHSADVRPITGLPGSRLGWQLESWAGSLAWPGNYGDWDHGVTHHGPMANSRPILVTVTDSVRGIGSLSQTQIRRRGSNLQISQISNFHDVVKLCFFP